MLTPIYIHLQEKQAIDNWQTACQNRCQLIDNLEMLHQIPLPALAVIQLELGVTSEEISNLVKIGIDVVCVSNRPNDEEGLALFQLGIKGYANTFSSVNRIVQITSTISTGNVWLGVSLMQSLIQKIGQPQAPDESWKNDLTHREVETTEAVLEGLSNRQIGEKLNITERTVKAHLKSVFQKLEISDRLELVLKIKQTPTRNTD